MEKSGHWIHPSQIFFSKTGLISSRKPPRGAHTDARIDAKLSHVQHSSTDKHGPSRDQAGTRRCVPHVAPRPEPFARTFIFPGNLAGYFSAAMRPAARFATRVSAYRLPDGHPRASRMCRFSSVLPCEPSRAPDADPPRRFNALDPSRKFCQLPLRFFFFFFLLVRNAAQFGPFRHFVSFCYTDSGDWQGWGAPDIHDDDGEPRARSPRSSVNLSSDSRRNSIDEPVRRRSIDLRNHGGGEGAIQGLDDPPLR